MTDLATARTNAANYLVNHFNPQAGLIQESPHVNPTLFWGKIDNSLALAALTGLQEQTPQINIVIHMIGETFAKYQFPPHGRIEIIFDERQPEPFRYGVHYIVDQIGKVTVETEIATGQTTNYLLESPDEQQHIGEPLTYGNFGDILCYAAMNRKLGAKPPAFNFWDPSTWSQPSAEQLLGQANALWDGTGINDKYRQAQTDGHYATYKLALNIIMNLKFGTQPQTGKPILATMLAMQDPATGGFFTDYLPNKTPHSDTNTETTSFALLALNMLVRQ